MAITACANSAMTRTMKLRWMDLPLTHGTGYSNAMMHAARMKFNKGMTGALTIRTVKNPSWLAGLATVHQSAAIFVMIANDVLETTWVAERAAHEVPEELAVDECPDGCPKRVWEYCQDASSGILL